MTKTFFFSPARLMTQKTLRDAFSLALLGGGYWLTVWSGLRLAEQSQGFLVIWPAAGVALGALLIAGQDLWRKILAVLFFAQAAGAWLLGASLWESFAFAFAGALESLLCAWALKRFVKFESSFQRAVEVMGLFAAAAVCAALASVLYEAFAFSWQRFLSGAWVFKGAAHGLGVVLLTPMLVVWDLRAFEHRGRDSAFKQRLPELLLFSLILTAFAALLFGPLTQAEKPLLRNYMLFPLLIWAAFRFSGREMVNALFVYSAVAVWNTLQGSGIFGFPVYAFIERLTALQIYLGVAAFSGLLLSAVVSERKNAEQVLRESQALLAAFISNSPIHAYIKAVTPKESRVLYASENFIQMIGVPAARMIGKTMRELFPPEFAEKITADDWRVVSTGKVLREEETLNGRIYTTIKFPILRNDKTLLAGYTIDITERKEMEEALRQNEEKYRLVANFTYDWESWHGPDGAYLYVSPACERITGYTADEFLADPQLIIKITHPEDRDGVIEHFEATRGAFKQRDVAFDFRIIAKDGKTRWVNHTCTAVYDSGGKWMGRRESNRDVTARKQSESVLRSRLRLSRFAENRTVEDVLQYALNEVEALTESQIGFFHAFDAKQNIVTLQMWSTNTLQNFCSAKPETLHYSIEQAGVWADCIRRREPVIYNNYSALKRRKGAPENHAPLQRILLVPIFQHDQIVAAIGVGNKAQEYDYQDIRIVQQVTELAWDVIQRKRSEDEALQTKEALAAANRELQTALERAKELSRTDPLTGAHNRRYLFELAEREFSLALRHSLPLAVILFDLDFFKKVNDTFGHDAGDRALQSAVETARAELRSSDIIGRYGGEEFVILLPMTTAEHALPVAERIRVNVERLRVPTQRGDISITLSIGIADLNSAPGEICSVDDLIRFADEAMYMAKNSGRNRIAVYQRE